MRGIAVRQAIPDGERAKKDARINGLIQNCPAFCEAHTILCYRAAGGEPCLDALIDCAYKDGKRLCYPYCVSSTVFRARSPMNPQDFIRGKYGIFAPDPERSVEIQPDEIDLVLLPAAAFDFEKHRIGMGGGYYDRYLTRCPKAKKLLVAYDCQRVETIIPNPFDISADAVVTEQGIE